MKAKLLRKIRKRFEWKLNQPTKQNSQHVKQVLIDHEKQRVYEYGNTIEMLSDIFEAAMGTASSIAYLQRRQKRNNINKYRQALKK